VTTTYSPATLDPLGSRLTPDGTPDGGEPSVWTYFAVLRRWKRLMIALPLGLALVAGVVAFLIPRKYIARAAFVPEESAGPTKSALAGIAAQFGVPQLGALVGGEGTTSPAFYVDLMNSQSVVNDVVSTRYTIYRPKRFTGTLVDYFDLSARSPIEKHLKTMKRVREKVVSISVDRAAGLVSFSVKTKSPQLSALIARRYLDLVNDFNLRRRQTRAKAEREFTQQQTDAAYADLRAAESELAAFRQRNRSFVETSALTLQEAALQRRVTLAQQVYTTMRQQFEAAKVEAVRNTPVITVIDNPEGLVEPRPRGVLLAMAAALVIGFMIAVVWAVTAERMSARIGAAKLA
jgi:uncharacterized protein involved in exopolysaccharide biosynthesis